MTAFKLPTDFNSVSVARWLTIFLMTALLFSPPLVNLFELTLFLMFICSDTLRKRLVLASSQPIVIATLAFYLMLFLSSTYSIASWSESLSTCWGWRKILLLPIAVALFDDESWKYRMSFIFIQVTSACAILSFTTNLFGIALYRYPIGIIIRNHATQGIMFSVAAFTAAILLILEAKQFTTIQKWLLSASIAVLTTNVIYITPGRSGYLALIVLGVTLAFTYMYSKRNFVVPALIILMIPALLLSSPTVRQRITQGSNEATAFENKSGDKGESTSMGLRMSLWSNTIELIQEHPFIGYGTGGFQIAYKNKVKQKPDWEQHMTHDPHNQFLKITAEHGVIGLLIFLGIILAAFRQKPTFIFYSLGVGVLLAWCGNSLFSSHFSTFSEGRFIFLWCGVMFAHENLKREVNA